MEKSEKGKREKDWESVCMFVRGKVAVLSWMELECLIEETTFEKDGEASFVDI